MRFQYHPRGYQILLVFCLATLSCSDRPFPTGKTIYGYWYETAWTVTIQKRGSP